jgi:C1A family cysteine protease
VRRIVTRLVPAAAGIGLAMFLAYAAAADEGSPDARLVTPSTAPIKSIVADEPEPGMGFVPPALDLPNFVAPMPPRMMALPSRFDWRQSGGVTSVKNQGACGSCYAFAAAGAFEGKLLVDGDGTFDLSENNIKECDYYGSSCGGGNFVRVANLLSAKGAVLETCDPYVASDVACNGTCVAVKTLLDWREISHDAVPAAATIKAYLQTYGPVFVSMNGGHSDAWGTEFNRYDGSYTLYTAVAGAVNHAVLIVGWDDNLVHAGGQGAWIVKNSWGTSWGGTCGYGTQRGYFTIAYGSASIGSWASFVGGWQDHDPHGSLLYYDDAGYTGSVGYSSTTGWALCKFVPSHDVTVTRVEFWAADATTDVDVYVYDTFNGSALSGLLASRLNSSFDLPGYHSVEIPSGPRISSGNDVYIAVKITDATYTYPLVYDYIGPKSSGNCYISSNGSSWSPWTLGDLGVRLRVTEANICGPSGEAPVLTSIRDVAGDSGGHVTLTWGKSSRDAAGFAPAIQRYKVWRRTVQLQGAEASFMLAAAEMAAPPVGSRPSEQAESGPVWELVGQVPATRACSYTFNAATFGDSTSGNPAWVRFYVSAHTGEPGGRFDSPVDSGYSVNNHHSLDSEGGRDRPTPDGPDRQVTVTRLEAAEPNPGRDGFAIRFDLATTGWAQLQVYDIVGRCIATLVEGPADAGRHVARWDSRTADGSQAAPGINFVRLMTRSGALTAKVVLVR